MTGATRGDLEAVMLGAGVPGDQVDRALASIGGDGRRRLEEFAVRQREAMTEGERQRERVGENDDTEPRPCDSDAFGYCKRHVDGRGFRGLVDLDGECAVVKSAREVLR